MSSELRASEMRMSDLVSELGQAEEELHRTRMERDDLRRVVGGLDSERDGMQVCVGGAHLRHLHYNVLHRTAHTRHLHFSVPHPIGTCLLCFPPRFPPACLPTILLVFPACTPAPTPGPQLMPHTLPPRPSWTTRPSRWHPSALSWR